jgi:REP element-mobilizing transposase RayT
MTDSFLPGDYFHVFSRTVGTEMLFRTKENYSYFMQKYKVHCSPHFSTIAYCLLPKHFHFLVQVKETTHPEQALASFSNFLNGYAKAYNKLFDRHGGLFQRKFKRKQVDKDSYLSQVIVYIHKNTQKHGVAKDFKKWTYSSYQTILSNKPTQIERSFVLDWFGGLEEFKKMHLKEQISGFPIDLELD